LCGTSTLPVLPPCIDSKPILGHDQIKVVRKLFQSAAFLLTLLLLAPPVVASASCMDCAHEPEMEMSCCAGMHGAAMPMEQMAQPADSPTELSSAACCTVTSVELSTPVSLTEAQPDQLVLSLAPLPLHAPVLESGVRRQVEEYPPGGSPTRLTLTRLCTFLI